MTTQVTRLDHRIEDGRAWTRADVGDASVWRMKLPQACDKLIAVALEAWRRDPKPMADVWLDDAQRSIGQRGLAPVLHQLERGRGFVILDGIPIEEQDLDQTKLIYWLIGQMLSAPWGHHALSDVLNPGPDLLVDEGVSFHTDATFWRAPPDYIGLLCLRPARSGGESRMLSAYGLHNALFDRYPHLLETLYQPFCFDRRGVFSEGEPVTFDYPVFSWNGSDLMIRYFNQDIHLGCRNAGRELTPPQREALNAVETLLVDENLYVEFMLEPGQALWANNRSTLHKRNVFLDHEAMNRRRHLLRIYLSR